MAAQMVQVLNYKVAGSLFEFRTTSTTEMFDELQLMRSMYGHGTPHQLRFLDEHGDEHDSMVEEEEPFEPYTLSYTHNGQQVEVPVADLSADESAWDEMLDRIGFDGKYAVKSYQPAPSSL
jgi:hypothetical protein